jgi:hypothetical protein
MTQQELIMEAAKLRLRLRMNNRLKLESQALLSRLFREHGVPVGDELLSCLIVAVPDELIVEAEASKPLKKNKIPPPKPPTRQKNPPSKPPKGGGHGHPKTAMKPPPKPPPKDI